MSRAEKQRLRVSAGEIAYLELGDPDALISASQYHELAVFASAAIGFAALAGAGAWFLKPAPAVTSVVARFSYPLAEDVIFSRGGRHVVAISPDGTKIAFIANEQIYLHRMNEIEAARPIRGTFLQGATTAVSYRSRQRTATRNPCVR